MAGDPIVLAENLCKRFGHVQALNGLSLQVEEGMVCGLLGPNGSGKTTAVRVLSTLLVPDSGTARIDGHDVVRHAEQVRETIGLAGQSAAVDEKLTGRENLVMFGRLYHLGQRTARRRADELLERFDLVHAADQLAKTYSGGMRRRLDLISSLIIAPKVLFLDEPTTGLDPRSRNEIWDSVRELVDDGTTVLLTTQYLDEADQLADDIAVVEHGRIIASGTPDELKATIGARLDVVVDSEREIAAAASVLSRLSGSLPAMRPEDLLVSVAVGDRAVTLPLALRELDAAGVQVADITLREPRLDEVFLALTGDSHHAPATPRDPTDVAAPDAPQSRQRADRGPDTLVPGPAPRTPDRPAAEETDGGGSRRWEHTTRTLRRREAVAGSHTTVDNAQPTGRRAAARHTRPDSPSPTQGVVYPDFDEDMPTVSGRRAKPSQEEPAGNTADPLGFPTHDHDDEPRTTLLSPAPFPTGSPPPPGAPPPGASRPGPPPAGPPPAWPTEEPPVDQPLVRASDDIFLEQDSFEFPEQDSFELSTPEYDTAPPMPTRRMFGPAEFTMGDTDVGGIAPVLDDGPPPPPHRPAPPPPPRSTVDTLPGGRNGVPRRQDTELISYPRRDRDTTVVNIQNPLPDEDVVTLVNITYPERGQQKPAEPTREESTGPVPPSAEPPRHHEPAGSQHRTDPAAPRRSNGARLSSVDNPMLAGNLDDEPAQRPSPRPRRRAERTDGENDSTTRIPTYRDRSARR